MALPPLLTVLILAINVPTDDALQPASPGCEDQDDETPCCPLEGGDLFAGPDDWWACLESELVPPREG